ncbi:hypothetical protein L596_016536 [Steinernema carpocapsae]|uniref:G-protein coupled receptors family 1 profile domain-containing protein n=1 Tax=Steinernema carpocapsae TaxID=34508 RepID=A0A4U5NJ61_STECR|nr:hypothetical protein L596_016536 [Steinernema carpocapsae]
MTSNGTRFELDYVLTVITTLDFILEPFFLFLALTKSTPSMWFYRIFLIAISLCNCAFSIVFFLLSAKFIPIDDAVCLISSHFALRSGRVLWQLSMFFMMIQFQIVLLMLIYSSYEISHPLRPLNWRSKAVILAVFVFIFLPASLVLILEQQVVTNVTCLNLSTNLSTLFLFGYFVLYFSSYITVSAISVNKIRRVRHLTSQISYASIRLVKTVVANFTITTTIVVLLANTPVIVALGFSVVISKGAGAAAFRIGSKFVASYALITTITSILIFVPYRRYTRQLIQRIIPCKGRSNTVGIFAIY